MTAAPATRAALLMLAGSGAVSAAPYLPADDAQVLERLPPAASAEMRELRRRRTALAASPEDLEQALELAGRYLAIGRAEGDLRYYGYVEAVLRPWWDDPQPPPAVLSLRANVRQKRHDFVGALADLKALLEIQPRNAQAWLDQAVVLQVRGDYAAALQSCSMLLRLAGGLTASACLAGAASLSGRAEEAYRLLHQTLHFGSAVSAEERAWAETTLAEIAVRLGHGREAERHFLKALALSPRDPYLLGAYADFLLDSARPAKAKALLENDARSDSLLLRLALAEQRLGSASLNARVRELRARLEALRLRGESTEKAVEAGFALHFDNDPALALQLALENWAVQREPKDARLVLESALAAERPATARPVLDWLQETGLEDVRLKALAGRIEKSAR